MASTRIQERGAPVHQLAIKDVFNHLSEREQLYAHHLSQAAWNGARIIMRQVSPEAIRIFDLILELHSSCDGQWSTLLSEGGVTEAEISAFLDYAALFLTNLGNFFADGGTKIIPALSAGALYKLAKSSPKATAILDEVAVAMVSELPSSIGYPGDSTQANYYPGNDRLTRDEIALVSTLLQAHNIEPENTRVTKTSANGEQVLQVLQASVTKQCVGEWKNVDELETTLRVEGGDHAEELSRICTSLLAAKEYCENQQQAVIIDRYVDSFRSGSLVAYRESQKLWVTDKSPRLETIFGFVEPYRDPHGVRAEWESIVCISDPIESSSMKCLVDKSDTFIRLLPWAIPEINNGRGPFEKDLFEAPDFASVHALASCSSIVWSGHNLPNYNDIRETYGCKNMVIANRISAENDSASPCPYIDSSDKERFKACVYSIKTITTAVHELLGHGTGKLLSETSPGQFNFNKEDPPINPLTREKVSTWYRHGQTWTGVFGEIATSVEECRAEVMSLYLMDNKELLSIFGHDDTAPISADELLYNTYLYLSVEGLQALEYYNIEEHAWGEPHREGQFAIFNHLLVDGGGVITVEHDKEIGKLRVRVDRSKLLTHGKPALGSLLCRIQIWRCIADFESCSEFWKTVSAVSTECEAWRKVVLSNPEPRWKFVQANTFLENGQVNLRTYDETNEGLIQSWVERGV
ncbi:hypothetical protein KVR01_006528 [Diaporthe batatas]|uniref:uncharacterized protein n=1 Tax=Diaporthe batatas TaxID=748121 RepID=UPI001D03B4EB|nr:uncharacterized protein KVR01_006528 [Diaporthe batatas]KAG8163231.1 hypothetical protein KVR01_006528 [Diaporthe batatas]